MLPRDSHQELDPTADDGTPPAGSAEFLEELATRSRFVISTPPPRLEVHDPRENEELERELDEIDGLGPAIAPPPSDPDERRTVPLDRPLAHPRLVRRGTTNRRFARSSSPMAISEPSISVVLPHRRLVRR